jgi:integrase
MKQMAVYKRYKGKRIQPGHEHWDDARWFIEFKLRGHHVRQSVPEARIKAQAIQAENTIRQAIFDRKYSSASTTTRFSDFVDRAFIPWARENKRSFRDDEQRAVRLKQFFGTRFIRDITPILIEKFKSEMKKAKNKWDEPFAYSTINRYLQVLSRIFSLAQENYLIDSNPMSRVKRLKEPESRSRYLTQYGSDEEDRLINALAVFGEYPVALVSFDLETGMRLGELLTARWEDVNTLSSEIEVKHTKNGKPRTIPLTNRALRILTSLRQDARGQDLIFDPDRMGRRRRQTMVVFEKAVTAAGLGDFHFHDLRRTFATRLRAAGVHEYDIADLLGHSTAPTDTRSSYITRIYARAVPQRLRDAVDQLERGKVLAVGQSPFGHHQMSGTKE